MKILIVTLSVILSSVAGQSADCVLTPGGTCRSNGPFTFTRQRRSDTPWNSRCSEQYQLTIDPIGNYGGYGFQCTMQMDVPEQNDYIYSFSEDRFSTWKSSRTPFIYGLGLNARVASKAISRSNFNYADWYLSRAHTHLDENNFSWISYKVENNQMSVLSSQGMTFHGGSSALFTPTTKTTYIGLNRLYARSGVGSGVCRIRCNVLHRFISRRFPEYPADRLPAGARARADRLPAGAVAPTLSPLANTVSEPAVDRVQGLP